MEDAVRPTKAAFEAAYERGYRTWAGLWEKAAVNKRDPEDCLKGLFTAFPDHPFLPDGLILENLFVNTVIAKGRTTWTPSCGPCDLSRFDEDVIFRLASRTTATVFFAPDSYPTTKYTDLLCSERGHVPFLIIAWAYVLSARWAELIPGAGGPTYGGPRNCPSEARTSTESEKHSQVVVDIGDAEADAANWWSALLCSDVGWKASVHGKAGSHLYSPWTLAMQPGPSVLVSSSGKLHSFTPEYHPPSFSTAIRYLTDYCLLHGVAEQCHMALTAALLIPLATWDNRSIRLPVKSVLRKTCHDRPYATPSSAWSGDLQQFDRLLTLSCNPRGIRSLLNSVFFDSGVACNTCGPWLQGSFAFLDSDKAKDPRIFLQTMIDRDPGLGFLWLGAFISGAESRCFQEARSGWWKVDLAAAAWTGTHVSFIQKPVTQYSYGCDRISREDECKLAYLCREEYKSVAPLFPFPPFGSTAIEDTDLEVRRHVRCSAAHALTYDGFTWKCNDTKSAYQPSSTLNSTVRCKITPATEWTDGVTIHYDRKSTEDNISEMVTRNIFSWLRGDSGYPKAEREIREHEWVENMDSDEEISVDGDVRSTAGNNLGGWLIHSATRSSYSI